MATGALSVMESGLEACLAKVHESWQKFIKVRKS
jgi:hypothetical protein